MVNVGSTTIASLLPNRLITTRGKKDSKTLYLTFDDGPHPEYTLKICDLLEKYKAKGTFFFIGENIDRHFEIAQLVVDRGHLIANHSNTHNRFFNQTIASQLNEINTCQKRILELKPTNPNIFRAPHGKLNLLLMFKLKLKRWSIVHWSYDSMDYKKLTLEEQLAIFNDDQVADGEILLFHDDNQLAIDILEVMLPEWQEQGYSFKTV